MSSKGATSSGGKRKFANGVKDSSSKKPKFEKRAPVKDESDDDISSDSSDSAEFSDSDNGGAALENNKSYDGEEYYNKKSDTNGGQSGKVFEKGWFCRIWTSIMAWN